MAKNSISQVLRVLLVEDEEHDAAAFRRAFKNKRIPVEVSHFEKAEKAIEALGVENPPFDVIVSDFNLPGINGLEMCKKIIGDGISIPIVILAGSGSEDVAVKALKAGVYDYLIKDQLGGYIELVPGVVHGAIQKHNDRIARKHAEEELKRAHDELEARVEQRTRQLTFEIESRKQAENKIREMARFPEESPSPMMRFAPGGAVSYANAASSPIMEDFGIKIGELAPEYWLNIFTDILGSGSTCEIEYGCQGKVFSLLIVPVLSEGYVNVYGRDVTEIKRAGKALLDAKEEAVLANRAKSEFLANISHELCTPLNAIIGFSDVISEQIFGPIGSDKYMEYVKDIHASGCRLMAVISDILDMSRIETGNLKYAPENVEIAPLVESCICLVLDRSRSAGVVISNKVSHDGLAINCDCRRFKQIVVNLLSNAVKFTPKGGSVEIGADILEKSGEIEITITDTGIGMAADDIDKAMTPFGQIDSTLARKYEGCGLGLPLAKKLAEIMGGALKLESSPEVGTTVRVRLPV